MPVTVICGGQFGSEGKGKVAHYFAKEQNAAAVVRIGGSNSGHTVVTDAGDVHIFRHLPTAAILPNTLCILPAGNYLNVGVLLNEMKKTGMSPDRLFIDPKAAIVTEEHMQEEKQAGLNHSIGSTESGTGGALLARISRTTKMTFAADVPELEGFIKPTTTVLRKILSSGGRVIIEGTQGFGLSILHSPHYPYVTSRDTTAAGFISEAGLSPLDVDDVVMVIRCFPIRVHGSSGPLPTEIDWETVTKESGSDDEIIERTSVTDRVRRVARFDPEIVRQAMEVNRPTKIVLNHIDHIESGINSGNKSLLKSICERFGNHIGQKIVFAGISRNAIIRV